MPFQVPNAVNYPSPLNAVPSRWASDPVEGPKIINCEVDWGTMGGAAKTLNFNLQNNATLNFSQIVALAIDNSACGADLQFSFPDTETTISIPAYAPYTIIPVFSNQTMFYLSSPGANIEDVTRFAILNSLPPPVAVPITQEQEVAFVGQLDVKVSGSSQIVQTGINGTLENVYIVGEVSSASGGDLYVKITDGNNKTLGAGNVSCSSTSSFTAAILALSGVHLRFENGINMQWTSRTLQDFSTVSANLYYRTP